MSEIIVRMEMPRGCDDCPFRDMLLCCCAKGRKYVGSSPVRHDWCPIVGELPEQHGRLIDASTVLFEAEESDDVVPPIPVTIDDYLLLFDLPTIVPATERSET